METNLNEIEQMRTQMLLLKKRLDNQSMLNEKHIRAAVRGGVSDLNGRGLAILILGLFALPFCVFSFYTTGMSYWFCGATGLMLAFCVFMTWVHHRELWALDMASASMLAVGTKVRKLNRHYVSWVRIGLPMAVVWLAWFAAESIMRGKVSVYYLAGACAGGFIGLVIGLRFRKGVIRKTEELLAQIDEFSQESEV